MEDQNDKPEFCKKGLHPKTDENLLQVGHRKFCGPCYKTRGKVRQDAHRAKIKAEKKANGTWLDLDAYRAQKYGESK